MKYTKSILTALFTVTFFVAPAITDPFSGFRADQLPIPQVDPPIQPAGFAFAIWGLIYGWLAVSAAFGLWQRSTDAAWDRARGPLIISLAVGTPWLAVANVSAFWASVLIFVMAAGAIGALIRSPLQDRWLLRVPVGIYAGWLTAASFVSLGSTAAGYGLITDALGWAYLGIAGAAVVAILILLRTKEMAYGLTIIWALFWITVANGTAQIGVSAAAGVGIIAMILTIAITRKSAQPITS